MDIKMLEAKLQFLSQWYMQDGVTEIVVNHPGDVWLRMDGQPESPWVYTPDSNLSRSYLHELFNMIAEIYEQPFNPDEGGRKAILYIPRLLGDIRFSGIVGRNVMYDAEDAPGGYALHIIRPISDIEFSLEQFELEQKHISEQKEKKKPEDPYDRLLEAIKLGTHILIIGDNGEGKTAFLNNILTVMDQTKSVISLEKKREIVIPQLNRISLIMPDDKDFSHFTDLIVSFGPEVTVGLELTSHNGVYMWDVLRNSSLKNCFVSMQAESIESAYEAFAEHILQAFPNHDRLKTMSEMKDKLCVVQINAEGNVTDVSE